MMRQKRGQARTRPSDLWARFPRVHWSTGSRWLSITSLVVALATPVLVYRSQPSISQAARLIFALVLGGATSFVVAAVARWLSARARPERVQTWLSAPIPLSVLVIGVNAALLVRLPFSSSQDMRLLLMLVAFGVAMTLVRSSPLVGDIARARRRLGLGACSSASGGRSVRIADGDSSQVEELTHLARSINQMADSVPHASAQRQVARAHRQETITAVSHDLRTPISCIQARVEALADGVVTDPATVRRYHDDLRAEVRHLSALVEELFELTRLESGALVLDCERVRIKEVVAGAVEAMRERAEQARIHITYRVEGVLPPVAIDARKINQVLSGLLENALRYTLPGGVILLRAAPQPRDDGKREVLVQVIDTGAGIAANDLVHVFEPTYRGEPSRKRQVATLDRARAGSEVGLGLTIAAHFIKAHGGQIWAASPLPPEALALVALPGELPETAGSTPGTMVSFTVPAACS